MNKELQKRVKAELDYHEKRFDRSNESNIRRGSRFYLALEIWRQEYNQKIDNKARGALLEIGAGCESITSEPLSKKLKICTTDISSNALKQARDTCINEDVSFIIQDAHKMKFKDSSFDYVVGRGILHHLELEVACTEIKRVMKQDGQFIFGEPLDCNPLIRFYRFLTPSLRTKDEQPLRRKDLKTISSILGPIKIKYFGFLTIIPSVFGINPPRFLIKVDKIILNDCGLGKHLAWSCLIYKE